MKILITCDSFNYCSGSATYVHDLAIELKKRGNEVTILSTIGGEITNSALQKGIKCFDFSNVFEIQDEVFDIIHCNQYDPAKIAMEFWDTPAVMTLHNSLGFEKPFIHPNIKRYIAAKPSEVETFKDLNPVLVNIGVDFERFNKANADKVKLKKDTMNLQKPVVFFIGTFDILREKPLLDLYKKGKEQGFEIVFVGRSMLKYDPPEDIKCVPETFYIEKWIEASDGVASILIGRTAIEAWACGKDYYCYTVDGKGNILDFEIMPPPEDMSKYDIRFMTDRIVELYQEAILWI